MSVLEIVFVGQCEVLVCLGCVSLFLLLFFFPVREGSGNSLKMSIFPA